MTEHQGQLPPGHECRRDDPLYETVGDWYREHAGRVPIQMAHGLSRYIAAHDCSFGDAWRELVDKRVIILAEETNTSEA